MKNCILHWLPENLQKLPIYQEIDELLCFGFEKYNDDEIKKYLSFFDQRVYFRSTSLGSGSIIVNWESEISWKELKHTSWENYFISGGANLIGVSERNSSISIDDVLREISISKNNFYNEEGGEAWIHVLEPYVGTRTIQRKLLEMLEINGRQFEWYERNYPINTYGFILDDFPGWNKTKLLIFSSKIFKNIESELYIVQDDKDYCSLILDEKRWDKCYWDSPSGVLWDDVLIIFNHYYDSLLGGVNTSLDNFKLRTSNRNEELFYWFTLFRWDFFRWDEDGDESIYITRTHETEKSFIQLIPAYEYNLFNYEWYALHRWEQDMRWSGIRPNDIIRSYSPVDQINWSAEKTWQNNINWIGEIDLEPEYPEQPASTFPFIPGYTPETGKSLYRPFVLSKRISWDKIFERFYGGIYPFNSSHYKWGEIELDTSRDEGVYKSISNQTRSSFVHLIPGYVLNLNNEYIWNDQYWDRGLNWRGVDIYAIMDKFTSRNGLYWSNEKTWEDDIDWRGEYIPGDSFYSQELSSFPFIEGFEPNTNKSIYNPFIIGKRLSLFDDGITERFFKGLGYYHLSSLNWDNLKWDETPVELFVLSKRASETV